MSDQDSDHKDPIKEKDIIIQDTPGGKSYFNLQAWKAMEGMARVFIASGAMPKHITNGSVLMVIMQTGRELGMMPMEAINSLYIVNGRVALQSQAMLTKVLGSGIKLSWLTETDQKCEVKFEGLGRPPYIASFTIQEANQAGLTSKPGPWKQYPKSMLRWRALAFGARIFCPDIIQGLHTVEELANVDLKMTDNGVFEVAATPAVKPPMAARVTTPPAAPATPTYDAEVPTVENSTPSLAQGNLLLRLLSERGLPAEKVNSYTRTTISKRIDELKATPVKNL